MQFHAETILQPRPEGIGGGAIVQSVLQARHICNSLGHAAGAGTPRFAFHQAGDDRPDLSRGCPVATRREERRAVWRELVEAHGGVAVFVDLVDPDLAAAEAQLAGAASTHDGDASTPDARRP